MLEMASLAGGGMIMCFTATFWLKLLAGAVAINNGSRLQMRPSPARCVAITRCIGECLATRSASMRYPVG
jgi:hypothetical protein